MESNIKEKPLFRFDNDNSDEKIKSKKIHIPMKPLSVNEAWQGHRYKTDKYKKYERDMLYLLPSGIKMPEVIKLRIDFGFSNISSDIDNPVKMLLDILQKKYKFNDSQIWELTIKKHKVKVGLEFILVEIFD